MPVIRQKAPIKIVYTPVNAYSKQSKGSVYTEFKLQDLGRLQQFSDLKESETWIRLPYDVEPGNLYEIHIGFTGHPVVTPKSVYPHLIEVTVIYISEDLNAWLVHE